jgi:hypothetical protein
MTYDEAVRIDEQGKLAEAAMAYEKYLESNPSDVEAILDLAFVYWQATDGGVAADQHLPMSFLDLAEARWKQLFRQAKEFHPERSDVAFWEKYILWADLGEPLEENECREFLRRQPQYPDPGFALFSWSGGTEAREAAQQLLRRCSTSSTTRCRYIVSVIESTLAQRDRNR